MAENEQLEQNLQAARQEVENILSVAQNAVSALGEMSV